MFNGGVLNYPTYDKELYALVPAVKKWKHYLMGKEPIIHTDHQPLQYLQAQSELKQTTHYKWMGFLQWFHLVIKYKKGSTNKLADMLLSRPPTPKITALGTLMHMEKMRPLKRCFSRGQIHVEEGDGKDDYHL